MIENFETRVWNVWRHAQIFKSNIIIFTNDVDWISHRVYPAVVSTATHNIRAPRKPDTNQTIKYYIIIDRIYHCNLAVAASVIDEVERKENRPPPFSLLLLLLLGSRGIYVYIYIYMRLPLLQLTEVAVRCYKLYTPYKIQTAPNIWA